MQSEKNIFIRHLLFFITFLFSLNNANAQYNSEAEFGWSIYASKSYNSQTVDDAKVKAPINYLYNSVNNKEFMQGASIGFKYDNSFTERILYSVSFGVNSIRTGTIYKNKYTIPPFIEDYTHYKADDNLTTLNIATHVKYLLPIGDMDYYKFYAMVGPSFDYKVSKISAAHLLNDNNKRTFINLDYGLEFDNKGYYILYLHRKNGRDLAQTSVPIKMERYEFGIAVKLRDLF